MAANKGHDALGSLLDGIDVFSKRQSMADMKSKRINSQGKLNSMGQMAKTPEANPKLKNHEINVHARQADVSADDLEAMFGASSTLPAQTQPAPAYTPSPAVSSQDPFLNIDLTPSVPTTMHSIDPGPIAPRATDLMEDFFMGAPPLHDPSLASAPLQPAADEDDDMFGVFSVAKAAPTTSHRQIVAQPPPTRGSASLLDGFGGENQSASQFDAGFSAESQVRPEPPVTVAAAVLAAAAGEPSSSVQEGPVQQQQQQPTATESQRVSSLSSTLAVETSAQPRRHRAFDYLEPCDDADLGAGHSNVPGGATAAASASTVTPLDHRPVAPSSAHAHRPGVAHLGGERTSEVVADLGHKAAKMLQTGGKWFAKASKTLAREVQSRIDKATHHHSQEQHEQGGRPQSGGGPTPEYFYDWAAQLSRISPGSRAAALSAMDEDERLAVQQIIDEQALGEQPASQSAAPTPQREEYSDRVSDYSSKGRKPSAAGFSKAQSEPELPSYDEIVGQGQQEQQQERAAAAAPPIASQKATKGQSMESEGTDLLGMDGPASSSHVVRDDLMGFHHEQGAPSAGANGGGAGANPTPSSAGVDIDAMFSVDGGGPKTATVKRSSSSAGAAAGRSTGGGLDSMIDLHADLPDVDTSGFSTLYDDADGEVGDADEPEIRKQLRQKRIQEKHERMMRQLAEKRARDEADEAERSGKVELREHFRPKIDAWLAGKKDNIRALLSSLHTVLWPDSGWTQPSMADMVENSKVKRMYMKANLIVHPDKVKQKGGTLEQITIADMVFDALKMAWGKFEASNK